MSLVTAAMAGSCQDGIGRAGKYTPHDGDEDDGDDDDDDDDKDVIYDTGNDNMNDDCDTDKYF